MLTLHACNTTKSSIVDAPNTSRELGYTLSLTDRLRNIAGVQVQGSGASAIIKIRGNSSILADTEPLFVLNGQPFEGDFATFHSFVDVDSIKKIKVLKDSGDLALYGVRGANGVILVEYR